MAPALVRLRLDVAYDGTDFAGWAVQPAQRTVQGTIESSLRNLLRYEVPPLVVAGRTDAGVHARGQVCHVDVRPDLLHACPVDRLRYRLARVLPADVRVRRVAVAPDGFDARFSALERRYSYVVCDDPASADPLRRRSTLWWRRSVDVPAMHTASQRMLGEHDFAAFCRPRPGATTIRTLREFDWSRRDEGVVANLVADAFCHSMVRALVGCLLVVGEGRRPSSWPSEVLAARVRDSGSPVVPALGLTLEEVRYPEDAGLAERAKVARNIRTIS
jgi:tRNA pseudouridine38-40 synthase